MSTKYIQIKKPPISVLQKRKNFSRQGTILTKKTNLNLAYQSSKDMSKINVLNFQSIFEYLYPHSVRKPVKSERKYFKSVSQTEISQIKNKIQVQNKKREEKSLKSLLIGHIRSHTERSQNKSQNLRQKSFTKRILSKNQSDQKIKQSQKNLQSTTGQQKQRKLLESTNFSIRAISCIGNSQIQQGKKKLNSSSILTKRAQLRNSIRSDFSPSPKINHHDESLVNTQVENLQSNEHEIDIKLSIKSMSKSEQGEGETQIDKINQNDVSRKESKDIKTFEKQLINPISPQMKIKNLFTSKSNRYNHLLIRFDKRLLLSASQINDPCLKIQKIKSISSRMLTEPNK